VLNIVGTKKKKIPQKNIKKKKKKIIIVENYPRNYETVVVEVDLPLFPPDSSASDR
jgi:hypothetical protein